MSPGHHAHHDRGGSGDHHDSRRRGGGSGSNPVVPGVSLSGVVSGVAGDSGGGHGASSHHAGGGHWRGAHGGGSRRGHGSHSSSAHLRKSVRFATTIDDGGQRTGSRGRYSPPPSPPRESEDARELDPRDHVVHHRGGPLPSSLSSRQSREDTPPGGNMHAMLAPPVVARAAREDTPPAGAGHGGGSIDSTATGDGAEVRSIHWSPYDRVGVVNAVP